ncbi:MAG: hypothetical protein P8Z68_06615 [Kineosporiaceae bacterium]
MSIPEAAPENEIVMAGLAGEGRAWTGVRCAASAVPVSALVRCGREVRVVLRLGEHGGAGLGQDLLFREVDHLRGHVGIADPAVGGGEVLDRDVQVVDLVVEAVLVGTEGGPGTGDSFDGGVDGVDEAGCGGGVQGPGPGGAEQGGVHRGGHGDGQAVAVVGADLEGAGVVAVEQGDPVELGVPGDVVELGGELLEFGVQPADAGVVLGAGVVGFDGQVAHALQDGGGFVEGTFSGLYDADAVLGVAHCHGQAVDLGFQAFGDRQPGRVVGGLVDPVAAGQFLQRVVHQVRGDRQVAVGVERRGVGVDPKAHGVLLGWSSAPVHPWAGLSYLSAAASRD